RRAKRHESPAFRSRRLAPPSAEGRWTIVPRSPATADLKVRTTGVAPKADLKVRTTDVVQATNVVRAFRPAKRDATRWAAAVAQQLLARHGVLTREAVGAESVPGGFGTVYPVLKAMEDSGRLRPG